MASPISIRFDGVTIDSDAILKLNFRHKLYSDNFKLGATPCAEMKIWVDKSVVDGTTIPIRPTTVQLHLQAGGGSGYILGTFHIDSLDDTNDYYYDYTLLDSMVLLNQKYDWSLTNPTVKQIVDNICNKHSITPPDATNYWTTFRNMVVSWQEICTERDIIGWVAEAMGCYAIINGNNKLVFLPLNANVSRASFGNDDVSDIAIGDYHKISRVVYDNVAHAEAGNTTYDTIYIDPNNIFFTDSGSVAIQTLVNGIYNGFSNGPNTVGVKNYDFYNMKCSDVNWDIMADTWSAGCEITVCGKLTIYEPDKSYVGNHWRGAIDVSINTAQQEETNVIDTETERAVNKVETTIDRQQGIIDLHGQSIDNLSDDVEGLNIHFQVNAAAGEARVTNQNTYEPTSYTSFKGDGMRIYVDNTQVAQASAQRFECDKGLGVQDWVIEKGHQNANTLIFYRRA